MTFGSTCSYTPFINHDGYFSPDMTLPYWGDVFLQRGKKSGYACSFVFMRSWWQKADVEALIDSEQKLIKSAKKRGEKYEPTWDIEGLKKVLEEDAKKDELATTPGEKERNLETSGIELVTGFQKGVGAKFFTFNPLSKTIVRTKTNKDPRGKMPIDWMYGDIDGNNPLGRGIVELIGGLQNLIDSDMQMYQFNRALALAPPVMKYGISGNFKFAPNVVVKTNDPNAKIVPLTIDTSAIANYPQLYGLQKSQLLNLVNSPDTSISAEVGNPGFSKTDAGVKSQNAAVSVDDNYIRKMFETWFGNWSETAINLYFAERSGIEELQLDKETAKKLRKLAEEQKFDIEQLSDDNKITIDYDTATPALRFRVDASTSKMQDDMQQRDSLIGLLGTLNENPVLAQLIGERYPEKIMAAWNSIVASSGVEDPDELSIDIEQFQQEQEEAKKMQAQQEQMAQRAQAEQAQMQAQAPQMPQEQPMQAMPEEMPSEEELAVQDEIAMLDQEDQMIIEQLQTLGIPEQVIQQAIDMLEQGATADEVLQAIGVQA